MLMNNLEIFNLIRIENKRFVKSSAFKIIFILVLLVILIAFGYQNILSYFIGEFEDSQTYGGLMMGLRNLELLNECIIPFVIIILVSEVFTMNLNSKTYKSVIIAGLDKKKIFISKIIFIFLAITTLQVLVYFLSFSLGCYKNGIGDFFSINNQILQINYFEAICNVYFKGVFSHGIYILILSAPAIAFRNSSTTIILCSTVVIISKLYDFTNPLYHKISFTGLIDSINSVGGANMSLNQVIGYLLYGVIFYTISTYLISVKKIQC